MTLYELGRTTGKIFDDIRGAADRHPRVFEVWNGTEHRTVGYLYWAADEWLAELLADCALTYTYRAASGREIKRTIYPLSIQADPLPPRRRSKVPA